MNKSSSFDVKLSKRAAGGVIAAEPVISEWTCEGKLSRKVRGDGGLPYKLADI